MKFKNAVRNFKNLSYKEKTVFHNKISMTINLLWAGLKLVFGSVIGSVFLSISGLYTAFIAMAKSAFFDGLRLAKNSYEELRHFKRIAWVLFFAGVLYLFYILEFFIQPRIQSYNTIISITIALFAFCEIGFSVWGLFRSKKTNDLLLNGLKLINLSSALSALVLTQIALLSLSVESNVSLPYNTLTGMLVGIITMAIAIYMLIKYLFLKKKYVIIKSTRKYFISLNFNKKSNILNYRTNKIKGIL